MVSSVELVSEGKHALVVLGYGAAAGVVVEAAEGLSRSAGWVQVFPVGRRRVQRTAARAGMGFLRAEIRKPAGWRASLVSISILPDWGKFSAKKSRD